MSSNICKRMVLNSLPLSFCPCSNPSFVNASPWPQMKNIPKLIQHLSRKCSSFCVCSPFDGTALSVIWNHLLFLHGPWPSHSNLLNSTFSKSVIWFLSLYLQFHCSSSFLWFKNFHDYSQTSVHKHLPSQTIQFWTKLFMEKMSLLLNKTSFVDQWPFHADTCMISYMSLRWQPKKKRMYDY